QILYVFILGFFFFQAEDGMRDFHVTGVQTCALPILASRLGRQLVAAAAAAIEGLQSDASAVGQPQEFTPSATAIGDGAWTLSVRSEERRVGKEGISRWWSYHGLERGKTVKET